MLKNILQLNGVQELNKEQKSRLTGGHHYEEGFCYDEVTGFYDFVPCSGTCPDGSPVQDCTHP